MVCRGKLIRNTMKFPESLVDAINVYVLHANPGFLLDDDSLEVNDRAAFGPERQLLCEFFVEEIVG